MVLSSRLLGYIAGDQSVNSVSGTSLPLSTWTPLSVSYVMRTDLRTAKVVIFQGVQYSDLYSDCPLTFLTTDLVLVGGPSTFIGEIASVRIFSPGTLCFRSKFDKINTV